MAVRYLLILAGTLFMMPPVAAKDDIVDDVVLGIHGGIGIDEKDATPEYRQIVKAGLAAALKAGGERLQNGGTSLDAVEAAIRVMEDDPVFNAGKGSVFTHEGRNELDASIMEGKSKQAGSVAGVTIVKNPISAARAVMEKSKHVMFIGRGAEIFATKQGLEIVDPAYFWTEPRWKAIQEIWKQEQEKRRSELKLKGEAYGTVGAVALDRDGNLAAGTSTGGMTSKQLGRVGDSPIIGAGTYADNEAAAISCTGHGEFFIRFAVAHEIVSQMKYKQASLQEAAEDVINRQLRNVQGEGGCIVLDRQGRFTTAFNSEGLYRASITRNGTVRIRLYHEKD
ncbi:MAG: isoaspartyl peptidase/L-asparaginase [Planctomycetaceae bacterium]